MNRNLQRITRWECKHHFRVIDRINNGQIHIQYYGGHQLIGGGETDACAYWVYKRIHKKNPQGAVCRSGWNCYSLGEFPGYRMSHSRPRVHGGVVEIGCDKSNPYYHGRTFYRAVMPRKRHLVI